MTLLAAGLALAGGGLVLAGDACRLARRAARHPGRAPDLADGGEIPLPYLPAFDEAEATAALPAAPPSSPDASPTAPSSAAPLGPTRGITTIVSHRDFDGLVSAALLLRALGAGAGVRFASPRRLPLALARLARESGPGDRLVVADLGLGADGAGLIGGALTGAVRRGVDVRWFDHHVWPPEALAAVRSSGTVLAHRPDARSAAAMIGRDLLPDDAVAGRLLATLAAGAETGDPGERNTRRLMIGALATGDDGQLEEVARQLATGNQARLGLSGRILVRQAARQEEATAALAALEHRRERTAGGREFLVIDGRACRTERTADGRRLWVVAAPPAGPMVARQACQRTGAAFALMLWSASRYSLSRRESTIDFRRLFGIESLGPTPARIAGHAYAAGVSVDLRLRDRLRLLVDWSIPAPAEALIERLRRDY